MAKAEPASASRRGELDPAPSAEALAERLAPVIFRLYRGLRRETALRGLSPQDPVLLKQIERLPGVGVRELADLERLRPATITSHVDRLEKAGLVVRRGSATDRRRVGLEITDLGRATIAAASATRLAYLSQLLATLDESDRAQLSAGLNALEKLESL